MPKGWMKAPVSDGWVQIIRGPPPKSERWPHANRMSTRYSVRRSHSPTETAQSSAVESRGSERRGSRETSARCSGDGQSPVQSPCPREDGIMSEVLRTGQARDEGRGTHHKGHRVKGSVLPRGQGVKSSFRSSSASSICGADGGRFQIDALFLEQDSLQGMHKTMPGVWSGDGPQARSYPALAHFRSSMKCGAIGTAS